MSKITRDQVVLPEVRFSILEFALVIKRLKEAMLDIQIGDFYK